MIGCCVCGGFEGTGCMGEKTENWVECRCEDLSKSVLEDK